MIFPFSHPNANFRKAQQKRGSQKTLTSSSYFYFFSHVKQSCVSSRCLQGHQHPSRQVTCQIPRVFFFHRKDPTGCPASFKASSVNVCLCVGVYLGNSFNGHRKCTICHFYRDSEPRWANWNLTGKVGTRATRVALSGCAHVSGQKKGCFSSIPGSTNHLN